MFETVHRAFNNETTRRILVKSRMPLALLALVLLATQMKREWFWPGLAVSCVGEFLQCWCFASLKKQKVLAVNGLYGFVRNPMYIARFLLLLGAFVMTANVWLTVGFAVLYYFYMVNRVKREEAVLAGIFGEPYQEYCRLVPRFLPRLRGHPDGQALVWSWELFRRNNGWRNAAAAVVMYVACWWYLFRM